MRIKSFQSIVNKAAHAAKIGTIFPANQNCPYPALMDIEKGDHYPRITLKPEDMTTLSNFFEEKRDASLKNNEKIKIGFRSADGNFYLEVSLSIAKFQNGIDRAIITTEITDISPSAISATMEKSKIWECPWEKLPKRLRENEFPKTTEEALDNWSMLMFWINASPYWHTLEACKKTVNFNG